MASYTKLTRELVEQIISSYPVGRVRGFHPLEGGLANSSIKVDTAAGAYVLSVCDEKDFAEISRLCSILSCLEAAGFPATRVIPAEDGRLYLDHDGKPVYLKQYISGQVVNQLDAQQLFQVGAALAGLHALRPPAVLERRFSYGVESFVELEGTAGDDDYLSWLSRRRHHLAEGCDEALPRGFIHGDLFCDNLLFAGTSLVALLDFEEACEYFLVFDIGMAAAGCCSAADRLSLELTGSLVAGYQSVRELEALERELLQRHIEYAAAATSFWRYRQYNLRNPDVPMKHHYRVMHHLARQVAGIDPARFVGVVFG